MTGSAVAVQEEIMKINRQKEGELKPVLLKQQIAQLEEYLRRARGGEFFENLNLPPLPPPQPEPMELSEREEEIGTTANNLPKLTSVPTPSKPATNTSHPAIADSATPASSMSPVVPTASAESPTVTKAVIEAPGPISDIQPPTTEHNQVQNQAPEPSESVKVPTSPVAAVTQNITQEIPKLQNNKLPPTTLETNHSESLTKLTVTTAPAASNGSTIETAETTLGDAANDENEKSNNGIDGDVLEREVEELLTGKDNETITENSPTAEIEIAQSGSGSSPPAIEKDSSTTGSTEPTLNVTLPDDVMENGKETMMENGKEETMMENGKENVDQLTHQCVNIA